MSDHRNGMTFVNWTLPAPSENTVGHAVVRFAARPDFELSNEPATRMYFIRIPHECPCKRDRKRRDETKHATSLTSETNRVDCFGRSVWNGIGKLAGKDVAVIG